MIICIVREANMFMVVVVVLTNVKICEFMSVWQIFFVTDKQQERHNFAYLTVNICTLALFARRVLRFSLACVFDKVQADFQIFLDDMKKESVIEKQHSATDWVSSLLGTTSSNGKLQ